MSGSISRGFLGLPGAAWPSAGGQNSPRGPASPLHRLGFLGASAGGRVLPGAALTCAVSWMGWDRVSCGVPGGWLAGCGGGRSPPPEEAGGCEVEEEEEEEEEEAAAAAAARSWACACCRRSCC